MGGEPETGFNERIASNLRRVIEEHGLNRLEVATRSGLNPTAVYDILNGKSKSPRMETLHRIATIGIGVSLREVLGDPKSESTSGPTKELEAIIRSLPAELQSGFTHHVTGLARLLVEKAAGTRPQ